MVSTSPFSSPRLKLVANRRACACTGGSYAAPGIINPTYQTFLTASNAVTANTNLPLLQTTYPVNLYALKALFPLLVSVFQLGVLGCSLFLPQTTYPFNLYGFCPLSC